MATYKVIELSFIKDRLYKPGDTVEYDGEPGYNLELLVSQEKKKQKKFESTGATKNTEDSFSVE